MLICFVLCGRGQMDSGGVVRERPRQQLPGSMGKSNPGPLHHEKTSKKGVRFCAGLSAIWTGPGVAVELSPDVLI